MIYVEVKKAILVMAVEREKEFVTRMWKEKNVSEKRCDAQIFKPERNVTDILKLIRVEGECYEFGNSPHGYISLLP